jgi:hypothetical protein
MIGGRRECVGVYHRLTAVLLTIEQSQLMNRGQVGTFSLRVPISRRQHAWSFKSFEHTNIRTCSAGAVSRPLRCKSFIVLGQWGSGLIDARLLKKTAPALSESSASWPFSLARSTARGRARLIRKPPPVTVYQISKRHQRLGRPPPFVQLVSALRMVEDNTLIQGGGWALIALALGIAASGYRSSRGKPIEGLMPVVLCAVAADS